MDHLQTIKLLIQKTNEYNIQLHFEFTDFHNADNTNETLIINGGIRLRKND